MRNQSICTTCQKTAWDEKVEEEVNILCALRDGGQQLLPQRLIALVLRQVKLCKYLLAIIHCVSWWATYG
jgi:hypothetical protein